MTNVLYVICVLTTAVIAFLLGARLSAPRKQNLIPTTITNIIKHVRTIAEFAALEYVAEAVIDINEKTVSLIFVRWKKGLLRYTAKIKVGFDLEQVKYEDDDAQRLVRIILPKPKVLSCEIYNKRFYKLPLETAENIPWKYDILEDFTSAEVLGLEELAKKNALKILDDFGVLDSQQGRIKLMAKAFLSSCLPGRTVEILVAETESSQPSPKLLEGKDSGNQDFGPTIQ